MTKITLHIEGMMCPRCEAHMNETVTKAYPKAKVTSSHTKKETVILTSEAISDEKLSALVTEAGYKLEGIDRAPYEKKGIIARLIK